eukprot:TRINITY_DN53353_c0_g1_i1.p1 TRINITY_DN53353_c0_g1~~TRINITY_DN53353_c0_g1_i1.p1  ORF type:complete len:712 (+),score=101.38 TRINITY_DN53353_c0_g1_i1:34-2169(+)
MAEGSAPPDADDKKGDKDESAGEDVTLPSPLNLLHFLSNTSLADCEVRVTSDEKQGAGDSSAKEEPTETPKEGASFQCHRVVLCAGSGYFYRKLVLQPPPSDETSGVPVIELPGLPSDATLRKHVDSARLFPIVLKYLYAGLSWAAIQDQVTAEDIIAIVILSNQLQIAPLAAESLAHLEKTALTAKSVAGILRASVCMRHEPSGTDVAVWESLVKKCTEVLVTGFSDAADGDLNMQYLTDLPMELLEGILHSDDLAVATEAQVLQFVRRVLLARLSRQEAELQICNVKFCGALAATASRFSSAAWDFFVAEERHPTVPLSDRYRKTAAATAGETSGDHDVVGATPISICIPWAAVSSNWPGHVAVRARSSNSKQGPAGTDGSSVLLGTLLTNERLQVANNSGSVAAPGVEKSEPVDEKQQWQSGEASLKSGAGEAAGIVKFQWLLQRLPAPDAASATEPPNDGEDGAAATSKEKSMPEAPICGRSLTEVDARHLLAAVRFPHLSHPELLAATKDTVLIEAGAQQQVIDGLSSRLNIHEPTADGGVPKLQPARRSIASCAALLARPPSGPAKQTMRRGSQASVKQAAAATAFPSTGRSGGAFRPAGHPLFPCSCGGQLVLRQSDSDSGARQWCAQCTSHPCTHAVWLPACVVAAAVDGHCASCSLRLKSDVRTLTVRMSGGQSRSIVPGGGDTLKGLCVAGCSGEVLQRLT